MVKPFSRPLLIHETSFRRKLLLNQQEPLKLLRETAVLLKLEFRRCRRDAFISFDFIAGDKVSKKMIYLHATSHLEMRSATGCVCLWNCLRIGWWDLDGVVFCWTRFIYQHIVTLSAGLDLSHNRMSSLPAEVSSLTQLESVDIGHNSFVSLPECLFQAPKITEIDARKNFIAGAVIAVR